MSQVASLRRSRERRAAMTEQQKEDERQRNLSRYHANKAKGKHQTGICLRGMDEIERNKVN